MLEVKFNLATGQSSPIPDKPHILKLTHYDRLTTGQQFLLRQFILRKQIHASPYNAVESDVQTTQSDFRKLKEYIEESRQHHPKMKDTWMAHYIFNVRTANLFGLPFFRLAAKHLCYTMD